MADRNSSEADWRAFRDLREVALDRFCRRVLAEIRDLSEDTSASHHERYRAIYGLLQERDDELAGAFDAPRRSRMLWQLAAIHGHGLLEPSELARFSAETRETIESIAKHT